MSDELVKLARMTVAEQDAEDRVLYRVFVNPDGPALAARIEADARRIAELERLVKEARELVGRIVGGKPVASDGYREWVCHARALLARMGGSDGSA